MLAVPLLVTGVSSSLAATSGGCGLRNNCQTTTPIGGAPGTSTEIRSEGSPQGVPITFTPGPTVCTLEKGYKNPQDREISCTWGEAAWSNERQCYIKVADSSNEAVQERSETKSTGAPGAYYFCQKVFLDGREPVVSDFSIFWADTPPPGITRLSPAQAAYMLIQTFQLEGVDIGLVPRTELGRRGAVGLPVWMWVNNPTPATWGPWTKTDTFGGVTVTATARATGVDWDMGDGNTVFCAGLGTEFVSGVSDANGAAISPDCGYRYEQMSPNEGRFPYTITARTHWVFEWEAEGQSGTDTTETTSTTTARIGELQSVNVLPNQ